MNQPKGTKDHPKGYVFRVDVLLEGKTNGAALQQLLSILNTDKVKDYKIISGIELGRIIDASLEAESANAKPIPLPKDAEPANRDILDLIEQYKHNNTLVRMNVVKGKGVKLSLPCRILNYDENSKNITVYHVDEKKVYQFNISEIDDFQAS